LVDHDRTVVHRRRTAKGDRATSQSLTLVILTFNEEHNIAACIDTVKGADEILVLDSGSTDRTVEVASASGAKVLSRALTDFADQRNYAMSLATCDWVLHLDADERVTPELWSEIAAVTSIGGPEGFLVPCLNVVFGAPLRHGGWYPQYHLRLQRRDKAMWTGNVHEAATVGGAVGKLRQPILHFGHPDVRAFLGKLDRYTTLEARHLEGSIFVLGVLAITMPLPYFVYKYVVQRGFMDGWRGLAAALLLSFYRCVMYLKAIERIASRDVSAGANG
jgi:glycosyltransferase involved in cell wall biosynthesis